MQPLKVNSVLQGGTYKIEEVLGQGGFGITYLATQALLDRNVCIFKKAIALFEKAAEQGNTI